MNLLLLKPESKLAAAPQPAKARKSKQSVWNDLVLLWQKKGKA